MPRIIPFARAEDDAHMIETPCVWHVRQIIVGTVEVDVFVVIAVEKVADVEGAAQADQMTDQIRMPERDVRRMRSEMELLSWQYPLPFLAGLFNSSAWAALMAGRAATSIAGRAQPNDYADQPIPVPDPILASEVGIAATSARLEGMALSKLLAEGWQRHAQGWRSPPAIAAGVQQALFGIARTRWGLTIERPTARCGTLRRDGMNLLSGQRVAARLELGTNELAADFLLRLLTAQGTHTLQSVEAGSLSVPLRPQDAAAAELALLTSEQAALDRERRILDLRAGIDQLITPLFEVMPHPPVESVMPFV